MKKRGARLGQHFLTGTWAAKKLVDAAAISAGDTVLEIGPGKGALTKELLKTGARVVAVEKDEQLVARLHETFASEIGSGALKILADDVRNFDPAASGLRPAGYILAANIPYYITGEIIRRFLSSAAQPKTMALLVQKEVAERILARDKKESILSISVKVNGSPEIAAKVAKGNFNPPPSVDSAILVIRGISKEFFSELDEEFFFSIVRTGFSSKRKLLAGNLARVFGKETVACAWAEARLPAKVRSEDLSLTQWKALALSLRSDH